MTNLSTTSNGKDQESPITIDEKDILGSIPQGIDMKLHNERNPSIGAESSNLARGCGRE